MAKCFNRVLDGVGIALVFSSGALITATLMLADPVGSALCGIEGGSFAGALQFMPAYFIMLMAGIGNSARPYVRALLARDFSRQDLKRVFLGLVISGGSVYRQGGKYCLRYYGKDAGMHDVFRDLSSEIYSTTPKTLRIESRGTYMTQLYSKVAVLEMSEFSPEMASRKGGAPTISYILEGDARVKIEAARVVMSNSGWLTCSFYVHDGMVKAYPRLGFGSVLEHNLAGEYVQLFNELNMHMGVYENAKYPQTSYLATTNFLEMQNFLHEGGFLGESTVKKGTFSGMGKNRLLKAMVDARDEEYQTKDIAIGRFRGSSEEESLELRMYLDRLKLG